jgi:hypothetical protein
MQSPLLRSFLTSIFFALGAATAAAAPVECAYDTWRGATSKNIAVTWVGLGFIADPARGIVQIRVPDGYYQEEKSTVVKQANFTGLVFYRDEKASDGSLYRVRYSFRIYNSGKCEGRMDQRGFSALVASGRVK